MTEPVRRPTVVTAAGALLYAAAALAVVIAVLPLPYISKVKAAAKDAYAALPNAEQAVSFLGVISIISFVVGLLVAITLAVLATFDLRGRNGARIATWVVAGLAVLCCGGGTITSRVTGGLNTSSSVNGVDTQEAARKVAAVYPSWYQPTATLFTVLMVLALIGAIILLALPVANPYFRPAAVFVPPTGPNEPPYPTAGNQPPYPPSRPDEPPYPPTRP